MPRHDARVYVLVKPLAAGALAIACGAWAVGSTIGGTGAPPPDTGGPVVVMTSTSPPPELTDSRPAGHTEDGDAVSHSGGRGSGDRHDDDERDGSRPAAPRVTDDRWPVNGQTGARDNQDDVDGEVEIPRQVEAPDNQDEDDHDEDDEDGDGAPRDDDGGGDD